MQEEWRDIEGYEGLYQVSNLGNVRSLDRYVLRNGHSMFKKGIMLSPKVNQKGYYRVSLSKDTKQRTYALHRLVAQAFIPNPENKPEINHIDADKSNNNVNNLEWCTRQENINHSVENELKEVMIGEKNGRYNKGKPVRCINTGKEYVNSSRASEDTGANRNSIRKCCEGKSHHAGTTSDGTELKWEYV